MVLNVITHVLCVCVCVCVQVRSLDTQMSPERLKVITQQVEEEQAILQSQTLLRLQQIHAADRQTHSPQVRNIHTHSKKQWASLFTLRFDQWLLNVFWPF